jgi:cysteine synthase A
LFVIVHRTHKRQNQQPIAVAMMCAQRGYRCVIVMAEPFSIERRKLMRMLGAKVVVTPKAGKGTGMVEKARELAEKNGW